MMDISGRRAAGLSAPEASGDGGYRGGDSTVANYGTTVRYTPLSIATLPTSSEIVSESGSQWGQNGSLRGVLTKVVPKSKTCLFIVTVLFGFAWLTATTMSQTSSILVLGASGKPKVTDETIRTYVEQACSAEGLHEKVCKNTGKKCDGAEPCEKKKLSLHVSLCTSQVPGQPVL